MSLLKTVKVNEAEGRVKEMYDEIEAVWGRVPHGMQLWSANLEAFEMHWSAIKKTMSKSDEEKKFYTMIRFLISTENSCEYCMGMNGAMLINFFGLSEDELFAMKQDISKAPIDKKRQALLLLAVKSIEDADAINKEDIEMLKTMGIEESEMFDAVRYAGYMSLVNTLFRTFKVEED